MEAALTAGAVAARLTGAGFGGSIVALDTGSFSRVHFRKTVEPR